MADDFLDLYKLTQGIGPFSVERLPNPDELSAECQLPPNLEINLNLPPIDFGLPEKVCDNPVDIPLIPLPHVCVPNIEATFQFNLCGDAVDSGVTISSESESGHIPGTDCDQSLGGEVDLCFCIPTVTVETIGNIVGEHGVTVSNVQQTLTTEQNGPKSCDQNIKFDKSITIRGQTTSVESPDYTQECTDAFDDPHPLELDLVQEAGPPFVNKLKLTGNLPKPCFRCGEDDENGGSTFRSIAIYRLIPHEIVFETPFELITGAECCDNEVAGWRDCGIDLKVGDTPLYYIQLYATSNTDNRISMLYPVGQREFHINTGTDSVSFESQISGGVSALAPYHRWVQLQSVNPQINITPGTVDKGIQLISDGTNNKLLIQQSTNRLVEVDGVDASILAKYDTDKSIAIDSITPRILLTYSANQSIHLNASIPTIIARYDANRHVTIDGSVPSLLVAETASKFAKLNGNTPEITAQFDANKYITADASTSILTVQNSTNNKIIADAATPKLRGANTNDFFDFNVDTGIYELYSQSGKFAKFNLKHATSHVKLELANGSNSIDINTNYDSGYTPVKLRKMAVRGANCEVGTAYVLMSEKVDSGSPEMYAHNGLPPAPASPAGKTYVLTATFSADPSCPSYAWTETTTECP